MRGCDLMEPYLRTGIPVWALGRVSVASHVHVACKRAGLPAAGWRMDPCQCCEREGSTTIIARRRFAELAAPKEEPISRSSLTILAPWMTDVMSNPESPSDLAAPGLVATVRADGWANCPACGRLFSVKDSAIWDGRRHKSCGKELRLAGFVPAPPPPRAPQAVPSAFSVGWRMLAATLLALLALAVFFAPVNTSDVVIWSVVRIGGIPIPLPLGLFTSTRFWGIALFGFALSVGNAGFARLKVRRLAR